MEPELIVQDVLHIGRQSVQIAELHIGTVVLDEAVGGDVVEVLGCCDLGGGLRGEVDAAILHQFDETVKLRWHQEGINRVAENDKVCCLKHLLGRTEVLLQQFDS